MSTIQSCQIHRVLRARLGGHRLWMAPARTIYTWSLWCILIKKKDIWQIDVRVLSKTTPTLFDHLANWVLSKFSSQENCAPHLSFSSRMCWVLSSTARTSSVLDLLEPFFSILSSGRSSFLCFPNLRKRKSETSGRKCLSLFIRFSNCQNMTFGSTKAIFVQMTSNLLKSDWT